MFQLVKLFFDDKRLTSAILIVWVIISLCLLRVLMMGSDNIDFLKIGPSETVKIMDVKIDTWAKWWGIAIFTFVNTTIGEFVDSSLVPWFQNTIQDHKNPYLPYEKYTCWIISQTFCLYIHVMGIFGVFLIFSQVDFLMIRALADLMVTGYSTNIFMQKKVFDKELYDLQSEPKTNADAERLVGSIELGETKL